MTIYDEAMQMKEELVACRRDFHAHPELAWTEFRTASHVAKSLKALGYMKCSWGCLHEGR